MVQGLGPIRLRRLLNAFGSPEHVLTATRHEIERIDGLTRPLIDSLITWESNVDLTRELALVREFGASIITLNDPEYPQLLREIHDPPPSFTSGANFWNETIKRSESSVHGARPITGSSAQRSFLTRSLTPGSPLLAGSLEESILQHTRGQSLQKGGQLPYSAPDCFTYTQPKTVSSPRK